jgi:hypothetical protein
MGGKPRRYLLFFAIILLASILASVKVPSEAARAESSAHAGAIAHQARYSQTIHSNKFLPPAYQSEHPDSAVLAGESSSSTGTIASFHEGLLLPDSQTALSPIRQDEPLPDETCLGCHGQQTTTLQLGNGEILSLFVPAGVVGKSVHGQIGLGCVNCHTDVGNYPHPPFEAQDSRDVTLQLYDACIQCHTSQAEEFEDSVHEAARAAGNRNAAVCTDCHTSHAVQRLNDPGTDTLLPEARQWIPQTCAKCHYAIYERYKVSVHGTALFEEGNPDVPTCTDCHGVHSIEDPTTAEFRLNSPNICANCHTDPTIMNKYGLSTQVLDTYVSDFHGTTVTLFEKQHPDQATNKPVCFDCHGVHDIRSVDDPQYGLQIQENLLARCQACHPDAGENFPTAWLSHYIPSPQRYPLVFSIDLFYKIFIPTVLGGMAILVAFDVGSLIRNRFRKKS